MRSFRTALLSVAFFSATLSGASFAQTAPNPEALRLSREILVATHADKLGDQILDQLVKALGNGLNQANPGSDKAVQDLLQQVFVPEFRKVMPQLLDSSAQVYAQNFSPAELQQILDFYHTEIGQKLVDRLPTIIHQQGEMTQNFMRTFLPQLQAKLLDAAKAKGLKQPDRI